MICGLSLSGLQSALIALMYPEIFSYCLAQSGSFWWLQDNPVDLSSTRSRYWLSVGDQETETEVRHPPRSLYQRVSQVEGVNAAVQEFRSLGGMVHKNTYSGGHAAQPWIEELPEALRWLLSDENENVNAGNSETVS